MGRICLNLMRMSLNKFSIILVLPWQAETLISGLCCSSWKWLLGGGESSKLSGPLWLFTVSQFLQQITREMKTGIAVLMDSKKYSNLTDQFLFIVHQLTNIGF